MSSNSSYANIHVIGLGGTGTNIIQSLIESERLLRMISSEDFNMACLAVDVADGDLVNLTTSYKRTLEKLQEKGTSVDRLWLKALNVKFNTPNSLFEFMEKYNSYLLKDGIVVSGYKPWIQSSTSIPPLAGGVGRQRALSKAVYALNYYHYTEMNSVMSVYKDKVLTSKRQPITLLVYGLGGGTGSGMAFDFARHLRSKLGSAVPIVGLAILPSSADDLLARGPAPYTALMETELLFNRDLNDRVVKKFGEQYSNPFSALFFLALDPVYNNKSSLLSAKSELDSAVVDIMNVLMNFDLADMLSRVGTNNNFGSDWVHSIAYLKIRYPVEDYLNYLHEYLRLLENVGNFMSAKREMLLKINEVMKRANVEVTQLFKRHLISINGYTPETFDKEVDDIVHRAGRFEVEFRRQIKGTEDFAAFYGEMWQKPLRSMSFPEESVESALVENVGEWLAEVSQISKTYEEFAAGLASYQSEFENSVTASKFMTSSQIRQLRAVMNFLALIGTSIETLNSYLRAKLLADELVVRYAKDQTAEGRRAVTIGESELLPLFKAASSLLTRPVTESKMAEQFLPGIRIVKKNVEARVKAVVGDADSLRRLEAQKETEVSRLNKEMGRIRLDMGGKKKLLSKNLDRDKNELAGIKTQLESLDSSSAAVKAELEMMAELEKSLEASATYRKMLNSVVSKTNELNNSISSITSTSSYYERVVEMSEKEQEKIMQKILKEEESSLKAEGILKEIVDQTRFRNLVKSYVRIFSVANYAGLSDSYRSDMIWATVGIPQGLWNQDLQVMLASTLSAFSSVEASKSISIRQIPQVDPWMITFLIIFSKARVDQIEKFSSMKNDNDGVRRSEKVMFRSFLLEHGVHNPEDLISELEKPATAKAKGNQRS
ncbi:MAG TPA: tubulin-like doman-containing protein [Nitrososphaerales archaeon]|nr:tubulin-like doman-containing protein [Nitrososphaerales archaeon]